MGTVGVIFRRELVSYFTMPLAYVFIVIFLVLAGALTFSPLGGFFERGQADLQVFFNFHVFLYLFLIPALSMRLWAEERKTGTIELFLTLPITTLQAVLGKYFAAWMFTGIAGQGREVKAAKAYGDAIARKHGRRKPRRSPLETR